MINMLEMYKEHTALCSVVLLPKKSFFFLSWNISIDYVISYPLLIIAQKFIMKYSLTVRSDKQYIGR